MRNSIYNIGEIVHNNLVSYYITLHKLDYI